MCVCIYIYPCILCCDIHNRSVKDNKRFYYTNVMGNLLI